MPIAAAETAAQPQLPRRAAAAKLECGGLSGPLVHGLFECQEPALQSDDFLMTFAAGFQVTFHVWVSVRRVSNRTSVPTTDVSWQPPHLFSNRVQGSKEMRLDRAFLHAKNLGDFDQIHVFHEPKHEDFALPSGQLFSRCPDRAKLLSGERSGFRRSVCGRGGFEEIVRARGIGLCPLPKLEPAIAYQVPDEIGGNLHEPCFDCSIASKLPAVAEGLQEAVLCQALRIVTISQGRENEPEYGRPIDRDNTVEILKLLCGVVQGCSHGGR